MGYIRSLNKWPGTTLVRVSVRNIRRTQLSFKDKLIKDYSELSTGLTEATMKVEVLRDKQKQEDLSTCKQERKRDKG